MTDLYTSNPADLTTVAAVLNDLPYTTPVRSIGARLISDNAAGLTDYENWLGSQAGFVTAFCNINNADCTWDQCLTATDAIVTNLVPLGRRILWTVPGCNFTPGETITDMLAGTNDAKITSMFQKIAAADLNPSIWIRGPHEMNFYGAYPWCRLFTTTAQFKRMWKRLVRLARAVSPRFQFSWTPNSTVMGADGVIVNSEAYYPGDAYVDVISMDTYMNLVTDVTNAGRTATQAINYRFEGPYGINWGLAFAQAHNKPFGIAEYGVDDDSFSGYFNRMAALANENEIMYLGYWNKSNTGFTCRLSDGSKPVSAAAYIASFKGTQVAWTPALAFGGMLVDWIDVSDAATITQSGGFLSSIANKSVSAGGAYAQATGGQQPAYSLTGRNSLPALTFDGTNDNLIQTVVAKAPAVNEAQTTFIQGYLDTSTTGFQYFASDADATANRRSIGANAGNVRLQGSFAFSPTLVIKSLDYSLVVLYGGTFDTTLAESIQLVANGANPTSDSGVFGITAAAAITRRVLGADATNGAVGNWCPYTYQEKGCVAYRISPKTAQKLAGYLAWKWGRTADLPTTHPYKTAAPLYGLGT